MDCVCGWVIGMLAAGEQINNYNYVERINSLLVRCKSRVSLLVIIEMIAAQCFLLPKTFIQKKLEAFKIQSPFAPILARRYRPSLSIHKLGCHCSIP
jgi:hypothetical protein